MMDFNQDDDDDSDRTESYTPPPLDITNDLNDSSDKENKDKDSCSIKQQSIIVLDESFDQIITTEQIDDIEPPSNSLFCFIQRRFLYIYFFTVNNYWDQWPLVNDEFDDEERVKLYSIPDIDIPPSPPPRQIISSPISQPSTSTEHNNILDILTRPSSLPRSNRASNSQIKKRKKKKKPMSEYRPPSPFSPKPDYKSLDIEQLKKHAMRYGLSTTQAKGRLIKILDEIYNATHQYETDTDYEFETNDSDRRKDLSHTPPTPIIIPDIKKVKKRQAIHQMSSSDEADEHLPLPSAKKPTPITTMDNENNDQSDEDKTDHEGRFLELTVYDLSSSTTSSSSSSIIGTPPTLPSNNVHPSKFIIQY